jgi:hypothetical protein
MGIIEGAVAVVVGILLGRFLPGRRKDPKPLKSPQPICGCGHHHSYHDPKTGACGHHKKLVTYQDLLQTKYGDTVSCGCRQYSGPVPMPEYFAPEIAGGGS